MFGRASQKKVEPIEIVKAEEPKLETIELKPYEELPQIQEISVEYHKTTVLPQPKPQQPKSELPNTGTESTFLTSVIGLMSLALGGLVAKTKKEK